MATTQTLSHVYPIDGRLNAAGRLEIAGCDVLELAERFGTPAYVVSEDDLRARARAFIGAFEAAGQDDFRVVFASKAFGATAVMRVFALRSAAYASNSEIFLFWMVGTSSILLIVAVLFLRNQIRPILRLADAAESFGKGREARAKCAAPRMPSWK